MHILNINSSLDPISGGGTAERTVQMSTYLAIEKDIEVSILSLDIGLTDSVKENLYNINLITIPCINKRFLVPTIFNHKISDSIKNADIIHLMSHWTIINLISFYWIRKYKKPYVVCPAGALPIFGRSKILKKIYNLVGGSSCIKNANKNIAISKDEFQHFLDYHVDPRNIILIPNGVEPNAYKVKNNKKIRHEFKLGNHPFILFVGRLNYIKGPDLLLEAFAKIEKKFPKYSLIFLGPDNNMKNSLILESRNLKIQNKVKFIDYQSGQVKSMLYHAADLLVIPSRSEAMSIVVLEAAISETPVLMTTACGLEELTGQNGAMAVNSDATSIGNGLDALLDKSQDLSARGKKLNQYVKEKFIWENIIKEYLIMFRNIVSSSSK
jgi:glycosyltransferase involved in cell wall biosynthesis